MTVVGCTGHQAMPEVARRHALAEMRRILVPFAGPDLVAYSSLAAGADQMFAGLVLDLGGQLKVVIPSSNYDATFTDAEDLAQYRGLLHRAAAVDMLDFDEPSEDAFFAAGKEVASRADWLIAVWDGAPARGLGGSADVVAYARANGKDVKIVWPVGVTR